MRYEDWMASDERTPEEIRRQRLRSLEQEESDLVKRLANVRERLETARAGNTTL